MNSRLKHFLAGALLVLPLALQAFSGVQTALAADKTVRETAPESESAGSKTTVELNKLVFDKGTSVDFDNNGAQLSRDDLQGGIPVPGVEFTAYNITDEYTGNDDAIIDNVAKTNNVSTDGAPLYGTLLDSKTTDQYGKAQFKLPNTQNGKYQTYLIVETTYADPEVNETKTIIQRSEPLILTMPMNTAKNGDVVYLYPKNFDQKTVIKDLTDQDQSTHNFGDKVGYTVTAAVPFDVATRDQFDVTDTPSKGLDDLLSTVKVQVNGENGENSEDVPVATYSAAEQVADGQGTGFKLTFNPKALAPYAGRTLTITYDAQITQDAVQKLANTVSVDFSHQPTIHTDTKTIDVGGAKFVKKDAKTKDVLADAVFVLENSEGKIVTIAKDADTGRNVYNYIDADKLDYQAINDAVVDKTGDAKKAAAIAELKKQLGDDAANAVVAISDDKGAFEFTGLAYGSYKTVEIAAPKGYVINTSATSFEVGEKSYDQTTPVEIDNTPKGILPHTGGMGIYIIIALGMLVMVGSFIILKKSNRHQSI